MAPEARLYFQATESAAGGFSTPVPLNTQVFQPAYTAGARVHTNSWGSSVSDGSYTQRSREVDTMVWDNDDLVILFAVGNDGVDSNSDGIVDQDSIDAPSTAKNCIAVGAIESYRPDHGWGWDAGKFPAAPISGDKAADDPDGMAAFSSRGPVNDNRVKPDIVAPGTGILSTRSSEASGTGWGLPGAAEGDSTYYMFMGGTSMATPLAAGTATLVRQFYVDHEAISPSAALVKGTLINGADDIPGQYASPKTDTTPVPDNSQGWGRIIGITSFGSGRVFSEYGVIGVSKAAIEALTRYLAVELAPKGIAVNAVSPGIVETDALSYFPIDVKETLLEAAAQTPARRVTTPEDVANVVAFLCSDAAEMIIGQTIVVDGGWSILV